MIDETIMLSIIVTVYNTVQYLDCCIESIVNQTYKNMEIIIVNDGSFDESMEKCLEWKKRDNRIQIISKENGGAVSARKAGIERARGEYVGYVDSDDWLELDMYEKMVHFGVSKKVDIVSVEDIREYTNGTGEMEQILLNEGIYEKEQFNKYILQNLVDRSNFFTWNIPMHGWQHLYKRELVLRNQLKIDDRVKRGEDMLCAISCYLEANSVALIKLPLYHYRQVIKSARSTPGKDNVEGLGYLFKRLKELGDNCKTNSKGIKKQLIYYMFYTIFWSAYEKCLFKEDDELFPFHVPRKSNIAIIGAGNFGKRVYQRIKEIDFCNIVLWADSRWEDYGKIGKDVKSIEDMSMYRYDFIVLAILNTQAQGKLIQKLIDMGIDSKKIRRVQENELNEKNLKRIMDKF